MDKACNVESNKGFPILFDISDGDITTLTSLYSQLYFAFGKINILYDMCGMPYTDDTMNTSTYTRTIQYNKNEYRLYDFQTIQLKDKNGMIDLSGLKLVFAFKADKDDVSPAVILFSINVYQSSNTAATIDTLVNDISSNIPIGTECFAYYSCIPYAIINNNVRTVRGKQILVIEVAKRFNLNGLSNIIKKSSSIYKLNGYNIYTLDTNNKETTNFNELGYSTDVYSTTIIDKEDIKKKIFYYKFNGPNADISNVEPSKLLYLNKMKCYPVRRRQDIKSDMLLIDPATGKRMDNYLKEVDTTVETETQTSKKSSNMILIVIGSILAAIAAIFIIYIIIYFVFSKKKASTVTDVAADAASGAAATN